MKIWKRILSVLLAAALVAGLTVAPAAAEEGKFTVSVETGEVKVDGSVTAVVRVTNNPGYRAMTLRVYYKSNLTCTYAATNMDEADNPTDWGSKLLYTGGSAVENGNDVDNISEERKNAGWKLASFGYTANGKSAFNVDGTIACLTFSVDAETENGELPIEIEVPVISREVNDNFADDEYQCVNGAITVTNGALATLATVALDQTAVTVTGSGEAIELQATAQSTSKKDITGLVTWTVENSDGGEGVAINAATGAITVAPKAAAGVYTIKASAKEGATQGDAKSCTLTVSREPSQVAAVTVIAPVNSVKVPVKGKGENKLTFNAALTDQYGDLVTKDVTWTLKKDGQDFTDEHISLANGVVTVTNGAAATDGLTVVAAVDDVIGFAQFSVVDLVITWPQVANQSVAYGKTWGEIIGTLPAGSAQIGSEQVGGTFTLKDADAVPNVGDKYSIRFVSADGEYDEVKDFDNVTITKADAALTIEAAGVRYSGQAYAESNIKVTTQVPAGSRVNYTYYKDNNNAKGEALTETPKDAGTYWVEGSIDGNDNYNGVTSDAVKFKIEKVPLTVTANNKSITYGDAAPAYDVSYSGFVSDEGEDVLSGLLAFDCGYTWGANAGDYDITPEGLTATNYEIHFVKGTLTVDKKAATLTITAADADYTGQAYDESKITATAVPEGSNVTYKYYKDNNNAKGGALPGVPTAAGTYWVEGAIAESTNYNGVTSAAVKFTITDDRSADIHFTFEDETTKDEHYDHTQVGTALPTDSRSGSTFRGWTIKIGENEVPGGPFKTLTDQLLFALNGQADVTAQAQFTANPTPTPVGPSGSTSYTITAQAGEHGSISPSGTVTVDKNGSQTFTIRADEGYEIEDVLVDGASVGAVSEYTFRSVQGDHAISARFKADAENPFKDVAKGTFYYDAVQWAVANGVTNGYGALDVFGVGEVCTRGHIVTFLWRAAGCPEPVAAAVPFTDVSENAYYGKAVQWAVEMGITNGYGSSANFAPDEKCTRSQIVTFLWRFQNKAKAEGENPFTDIKSGSYYYEAALWAAAEGVTNGTSPTTFSPDEFCTRDQAVTFLYRCMVESAREK